MTPTKETAHPAKNAPSKTTSKDTPLRDGVKEEAFNEFIGMLWSCFHATEFNNTHWERPTATDGLYHIAEALNRIADCLEQKGGAQ